jgi:malonate decarboxylase delta subunit
MVRLGYEFPASRTIERRAHVGVVGSGDLEVLIEPTTDQKAHIEICTSVDGFSQTWQIVVNRFVTRFPYAAAIEIRDFGATPGIVLLRLQQAMEKALRDDGP